MAKSKQEAEPTDTYHDEPEFDPSSVKKLKQLVFPTLKIEANATVFVRPIEAMYIGRKLENESEAESKRGPATLMKVRVLHAGAGNALNGKDAIIVCNKLLVGVLNDNFSDGSYVGQQLRIHKSEGKKKGKNGEYFSFDVDLVG